MKKINLSEVRKVVKPFSSSLLIYLAYFVFAQVVISGGRYERDIYLWTVIFVLVVVIEALLLKSMKLSNFKQALAVGLWYALPVVILDYLIVNLILSKNSLSIFKNWETVTLYLIILLIPMGAHYFKTKKEKSKNQVDELLTNHKPTL